MTSATPSIMDTRREQMFPTLQPFEIERVRGFGEVRSFDVGEPLAKVGDIGRGFSIILADQVEATRYDSSGRQVRIVTHGAGAFLGENAQLAGRPAVGVRRRSRPAGLRVDRQGGRRRKSANQCLVGCGPMKGANVLALALCRGRNKE